MMRSVLFSYTRPMTQDHRLHPGLIYMLLFISFGAVVGCGSDDDPPPAPPPAPTLEITESPSDSAAPLSSAAELSLSVSASSSKGGALVYAWWSECPSLSTNGSFNNAASQAPVWMAPENLTGETQSCTVSVRVSDGDGLEETRSSTQNVASLPHTLTLTESPVDSPEPLASSSELSLAVSASDSWGSSLNYIWSSECSSLPTNGSFSDATAQATVWTAPENLTGETESCTVQIQVSSGEGLEETSSSTHPVASTP
ncbi:MAG: hypothetical protein VX252_03670, partial [Myxococcota bacterium]|nr:hypothetical protein [Myxococcota bacterium]